MAPRKNAPTTVNSAPGYAPGGADPAPNWQPPNSAPPANGTQAAFGAPPPQGERNPFLNAPWLWANGDQKDQLRRVTGRILGLRQAVGGNPQYANRGGWFLDIVLTNGVKVTARINIGDTRHQRLYAKFQNNIVGQTVTFRLSHPGDQTKAPWIVE